MTMWPHLLRTGVLLCAVITLSACGGRDRNLSLQCEGQTRMMRGNLLAPLNGVRTAEQDKMVEYVLKGRKLEGLFECVVWNDQEIRCETSKPDGTSRRVFRLDRVSLFVRDQVFTRGRSLTEEVTFEGECRAQ